MAERIFEAMGAGIWMEREGGGVNMGVRWGVDGYGSGAGSEVRGCGGGAWV